ncbi:Leucine-rich repeat serine/threonine-protein kinase 2 [Phytophthora pseudosyringae]|uniref:Leucine-rich repeat serine/threonine-protein kinase 2 n=1 Tax=Phytophthora pseudosyringae TaxID=221518 RepID=A0A8T1VWL5_9STRA|nr:Leucine-rich repeat serine/threonine-protein kinase 2 [Phytophthora pseudosyringae]
MLSPVESELERGVFMNEIKIWYFLNYPHVVKLHGTCHVGRPFFVCELASNGILTDFTAREEREGRRVLWQKLHEVALGLHFLYERNVTHGDLKGNNILVGADGTAELTDIGLSSMLTSSAKLTPVVGTKLEICDGKRPMFEWGQRLVMRAVPFRPKCLSDEQWELIQKRRVFEPSQRPEAALVVEKLKQSRKWS